MQPISMKYFECGLLITFCIVLFRYEPASVSRYTIEPEVEGEEPSKTLHNKLANTFHDRIQVLYELEDLMSSHHWLQQREIGRIRDIPILNSKRLPSPLGIYFERDFQLYPDEEFSLTFEGSWCHEKDRYGDNRCNVRWGDSINVIVNRTMDHKLEEGDEYSISFVTTLGPVVLSRKHFSCNACRNNLEAPCDMPESYFLIHGFPVDVVDCPAQRQEMYFQNFTVKTSPFNLMLGTVGLNVTAQIKNAGKTKMKLQFYVKVGYGP